MGHGPGAIERRIADLLAGTRDRALEITEITCHAFELAAGERPTRVQRLSATRAVHRLLRRVREMHARARALVAKAHADVRAALGRKRAPGDDEYDALLERQPALKEAEALFAAAERIGCWRRYVRAKLETDFWCATTIRKRLYFHPPDVPVQVWAVTIDRSGVHWFDTELSRITARNVMVRYRGEIARLDRQRLWYWWALWRGVTFVSSRSGRIAAELEEVWHRKYGAAGGVPPAMRMPLEDARLLLGLPEDYTREDVIAAFRRKAKAAHPDAGGSAEQFRLLLEARDRLLAALGTSAPKPKMPTYAPKGVRIVYRRARQNRLGSGGRRLLGR